MLNDTYPIKMKYWFFSSNDKLSNDSAEKVVNPPQNPAAKNNLADNSGGNCSVSWNIKPIKKEPKILTVKVPIGKLMGKIFVTISDR